jgi:hypothetical protein
LLAMTDMVAISGYRRVGRELAQRFAHVVLRLLTSIARDVRYGFLRMKLLMMPLAGATSGWCL